MRRSHWWVAESGKRQPGCLRWDPRGEFVRMTQTRIELTTFTCTVGRSGAINPFVMLLATASSSVLVASISILRYGGSVAIFAQEETGVPRQRFICFFMSSAIGSCLICCCVSAFDPVVTAAVTTTRKVIAHSAAHPCGARNSSVFLCSPLSFLAPMCPSRRFSVSCCRLWLTGITLD